MTREQVVDHLGDPLSKHKFTDGEETWAYSAAAPQAASHQNRVVIFASDGKVRETHACCED